MPTVTFPGKIDEDDDPFIFVELTYDEETALPYKEFVAYVRKKQKWEAAEAKREVVEKLKERKRVEEELRKQKEKERREEERRRKEKQREEEEKRKEAEQQLREQEQKRQREERRKREEIKKTGEDRGKRENGVVVQVPCKPFWVNDGRPVPYFPETIPGVAIPKLHNTPEIPYLEENSRTPSSLQKEICDKGTPVHQYTVHGNGRIYHGKDSWLPDRQRCERCIEAKVFCWRRVQFPQPEYRICLNCKFSRRKCCAPSLKRKSTRGNQREDAEGTRNRAESSAQGRQLRQSSVPESENTEDESTPSLKRQKVDEFMSHKKMEEKFWRVMLADRGIDPNILDKESQAFDKALAAVYRDSKK